MRRDEYHITYPDMQGDYYPRLMWLARVLQTASDLGIKPFLAMNKDHRERVEAVIGLPTFSTIKV